MKPSGVEWIGDVPEHWELRKAARSFKIIGSGTTPKANNDEYYEQGTVSWVLTGDLNDGILESTSKKISETAFNDHSTLKIYPAGSLIIAMYGATIGKTALLGIPACTNQACCVLAESDFFEIRFVHYWFISTKQAIINLGYGGGQPNINQEIIKSLKISCPPYSEQTAIIVYLDRKTAQIDQAITEKEGLIELFREERQAIINHAVTKGIRAGVKMKSSGVEWIGDVPEHWGATVFKRVTSRIVVGIAEAATGSYVDKGVPIIRATNIKEGKISGELIQIETAFAEKNESKAINALDIITVRTGYPGQSAVLPKELDGAQCFTMLISSLKESQNPFFYNLYLNSHVGKEYFGLTAWGSAQKNISVPILQDLPIPILPFEEQNEIVKYLDQKTAQIDTAISGIQQEISLLQEYRQALIFEEVTGKINVQT